ncbi:MAG: hypothetical protein VXZ01_08385 [Pseudomonadota bacterium]|nr:hypothetical protein [Pseudomonadota bacterium]
MKGPLQVIPPQGISALRVFRSPRLAGISSIRFIDADPVNPD